MGVVPFKKPEKNEAQTSSRGIEDLFSDFRTTLESRAVESVLEKVTNAGGFNEESEMSRLLVATQLLASMIKHLDTLKGSVSRENIRLRRQMLAKSNIEDLISEAQSGGPLNWSSRPAYYHALVEEIKHRLGV